MWCDYEIRVYINFLFGILLKKMGKKTAKPSNLGRSLIKDRFGHRKRTVGEGSMVCKKKKQT